jgi:peptidoglycan/LPS O-acetylase OafA/YrhL
LHFILRGIYGNIWSGAAAVIIFFVISGICVHFPVASVVCNQNRRLKELLNLREFYLRRYLRILIPAGIAISIDYFTGEKLTLFQDSILWSLLAELVYYTIYPLLLLLRIRLRSWGPIITTAYISALLLAATNPIAGNYPSFGPASNWILGLPCWLLGCALAEKSGSNEVVQRGGVTALSVWTWRSSIFIAACFCSVLRYHSPIGYPWTLNFFAILCAFWLRREISYRNVKMPPQLLERAGAWSYSLYLMHLPAAHAFSKLAVRMGMRSADPVLLYFACCFWALGICYAFYLIIEKPAHEFARYIAKAISTTGEIPRGFTSADQY